MTDDSRSRLDHCQARLAKWVRRICLGNVIVMLTSFLLGGATKVRLGFWVTLTMGGLFLMSALFCSYGCCAGIWYAANAVGEQTKERGRSRINPQQPPG
jgi:hypothetical protein